MDVVAERTGYVACHLIAIGLYHHAVHALVRVAAGSVLSAGNGNGSLLAVDRAPGKLDGA